MTDRMPLTHRSYTFSNVWLIAGGLFVASGILMALRSPLFGAELENALYGAMGTLFYGIGGVLFALGFRGEGSVTARRPLGTWALIALVALLPVVRTFVWGSLPIEVYMSGLLLVFTSIDLCVELTIALIAVIAVARAGVVPPPWCWAPVWAVTVAAVATVARVLFSLPGMGASLMRVSDVASLVPAVLITALGVLAIVLVMPRRSV